MIFVGIGWLGSIVRYDQILGSKRDPKGCLSVCGHRVYGFRFIITTFMAHLRPHTTSVCAET